MTLFRRTGVKAVCGLICVAALALAAASGAGVLSLLYAGSYDGTGGWTDYMEKQVMSQDLDRVMYNYFDPDDPAHPWSQGNREALYTGKDSNFIWRITDEEGNTVLSSYSGTPAIEQKLEQPYAFDRMVEEAPVVTEEDYNLEKPVFRCAGETYALDGETQSFRLVDSELTEYLDGAELPGEALYMGFGYEGVHYDYDGYAMEFYPAYGLSETRYRAELTRYTATGYLLAGLPCADRYAALARLGTALEAGRNGLPVLCLLALVLGIGLLILLGVVIDHKNGVEELVLNPLYRIPTDVALAAVALLALLPLEMGVRLTPARVNLYTIYTGGAAALLILSALFVYTVVMICARGKKGILFSGTLICWFWRNLGVLLRGAGRGLTRIMGYLPLLWKVGLCYAAVCLIEFLILMWGDAQGEVVVLWFVGRLICGALVAYVALAFRRLKTGAETIAAGDYTAQVEERHLLLDFKDTAQTLNHIRDGMNAAVDSRTRSERMKTELITNVSHDLKTPLTSIVSYVDLLKQELARSQSVTREAEEYLEVLDRQSARLKKLIEDLVEASKASTGNLTLELEPLDFNMLLSQALGEYAQRLSAAGLTLMTKLPEQPVMVRADGRRLWRVFDNLLGNAVKYALPGTRLYLNVEAGEQVTATFRNISREPLDAGGAELMERFVRGDASRHTEGSGLGLSIARSLTESMGGTFLVEVDGDLFKASVTLPVLSQSLPEPSE